MARSIAEQWYGAEKAARMRRSYRSQYGALPSEAVVVPEADVAGLKDRMDATIAALYSAIGQARGAVMMTPSYSTAETLVTILPVIGIALMPGSTSTDVQAAVNGGLDQMEGLVELRLVNERQNVLDGNLAPDKWFAAADEIKSGVAKILGGLKEDTAAAQLDATIGDLKAQFSDIWSRIQKALKETANITLGLGSVGLVLGLVGAFFAFKWIVAPTIRGYLPHAAGYGGLAKRRVRRAPRRK